jgi:thiamine pyrophosphokinase
MGVCYIVGAGDFTRFCPSKDDFVIAADGGYDSLCAAGIRADLLIGDLDSISHTPTGIEILRHPKMKDETDMHLSYIEGRARGYTEFAIYGGTGGRPDHTFANYSLLAYIAKDGGRATLNAEKYVATAIYNGDIVLRGASGASLSVFAFGGAARGVCIEGAEYEVSDITLSPEFPLGVSNSFVGREVKITVKDGVLLIIHEL